ncbi:hypothetical protein ALC62_08895 [Cyphomyrmex costatus]|uniref:Uncharacterized protein n=1 Tax=Cyphomyrmex costatus TaxID=456900 RepID=A0A195CI70_9HYME|nr:hypothetical protein ALC62_08895 [Cyphomyrmex costatus]
MSGQYGASHNVGERVLLVTRDECVRFIAPKPTAAENDVARDGKRGLASAVSSNRFDNLQEALEPRCGAGLVEDLPSGYPRNPAGLACRILHVPFARGSS